MDSTNLTEYCEYNARKAAKRRGWIYEPARHARVQLPSPGVIVHEHDASPSVRARIRNFFGREP